MSESKKWPHIGTAKIVKEYCIANVGGVTTSGEIIRNNKLKKDNSSVTHQLASLAKKGYLKRSRNRVGAAYEYTILKKILDLDTNAISKKPAIDIPASITTLLPSPTITPKLESITLLQQSQTTQPLDLGAIMNHVMQVDAENKVMRHTLEQMALLLDQAGIIQTTE